MLEAQFFFECCRKDTEGNPIYRGGAIDRSLSKNIAFSRSEMNIWGNLRTEGKKPLVSTVGIRLFEKDIRER